MSQDNGFVTAEQIRKANHKEIELPRLGKKAVIRKIPVLELAAKMGYLPLVGLSNAVEIVRKNLSDPDKLIEFNRKLVCLACVVPKVVEKNHGPDEVLPEDFGPDYQTLLNAVYEFSMGSGEVAQTEFPTDEHARTDGPVGEAVSSPSP